MRGAGAAWRAALRPLLVALVLLLGAAVPGVVWAQDADGDGIPDASDNCPYVANPGQEDVGGSGAGPPDGIGDACQCGDLNDDGRADLLDAAIYQRDLAGLMPEASNPDTCSVTGGRLDCDPNDLQVLREELVGLAPGVGQVCQAAVGAPPLPMSLAASGDSITQAFAADCSCNAGFLAFLLCLPCLIAGDQPAHSWFNGSASSVTSVLDRYRGLPGGSGTVAHRSSVSGAEMRGAPTSSDNFSAQVDEILALPLLPELVVVELGGNDVCNRHCVDPVSCADPLYSEQEWTEAVEAGLDKLVGYQHPTSLLASATVYLLGVPRVQDLRAAGVVKQQGASDIDCVAFWDDFDVCRIATQAAPLNGEDLSTRTQGIADRAERYNEILRDLALTYTSNANGKNPLGIEVVSDYVNEATPSVGTTSFGADQINGGDCFHPSIAGQNLLSTVVWDGNPRR
jgi:lysophospholipase L1-like esterase